MAQRPEGEITQLVLSQRPIGPGRPVGDVPQGALAPVGGCMPGTSLLDLSLVMNPSTLFATVGTLVQLTGSATVRHWLPDCSHHDAAAPVEWSLSYQSVDSGVSMDVTSMLVNGRFSPSNQFTVGLPGIYNVVLICPEVADTTSALLLVGRGAVLDGTATACGVPELGHQP